MKKHNPTTEEINLCILWYRSQGIYAHEYKGVVFATFEALTRPYSANGTQEFTVMLHPDEVRACANSQRDEQSKDKDLSDHIQAQEDAYFDNFCQQNNI